MIYCILTKIVEKEETCHELTELLNVLEKPTEFGVDISHQVAEGVNKALTRQLSKDTATKMKENFKVPGNCKSFIIPKMNTEIWNQLPTSARVIDLQHQHTQQGLSFGLIALSNIADKIVSSGCKIDQDAKTNVLKWCIEGTNLIGHQFQDCNMKRKSDVKRFINQEYAGICSSQVRIHT